ncbi:MAG: multiheme c-type cytochrome [Planctomycetota bacterium]|jgi:hypothetical protein
MRRNLLVFVGLCAVLALTAQVWGVPEEGEDPTDGATYIGGAKCKKCHIKQNRSWKKMKHAKAWETLPEKYRDVGQKDDGGKACVSCHVTGFGAADRGGFADAGASGHLLGVQCEACHGPGSKHAEAGKAVLDAKRKSFNEGEKSFIVRKSTNCADCHNPHVSHAKYKEG